MRSRWLLMAVLLLSAGLFGAGLDWGLPSSDVNRYLFGDRTPWTGRQIIDLAGGWDTDKNVGADVDRNPLQRRDKPIWLNETDAQRAEIVRRYRLFSYQPDEMITLRALSQIKPAAGQFDPKLYQYGGLWMYPVGALLKVASIVGFIQLTPDLTFYLDHPEAFGRFYIVARLYSALWGLIGVATVFSIVKQFTADDWLAAIGALGFALLPVVVCMSHEAKPHLGGAVLMLLAIRVAMTFVESGATRSALLAGVLCGAAIAMVPTSLPVFLILPAMVMLRPTQTSPRVKLLLITGVAAAGVYALINPYVLINAIFHRELLTSNAGNTGAMYAVHDVVAGVINAIKLIGEGCSWFILIAGVVGWLTLHFAPAPLRKQLVLLALPSLAIFAVCAAVAAAKPGEFGRFFILPDAALLIGLLAAIGGIRNIAYRRRIGVLVLLVAGGAGSQYVVGYLNDARGVGSRARLTMQMSVVSTGEQTIAIFSEPAPYCLPPVDLFKNRLMLQPPMIESTMADGDWIIRPVDRLQPNRIQAVAAEASVAGSATPISWANKPFEVTRRLVASTIDPKH